MKLDPVGDRVVLKRLTHGSALLAEPMYTHFCEVVEKSRTNDALQVGDVVIEPERWTQVPGVNDLIVAKTKHISAKVRK